MSQMAPPLNSSAVLLWLPPGESPSIKAFNPDNTQPPPATNPEPYWLLSEAVLFAVEAENTHGKESWIKAGETLLGPDQIKAIYRTIKASKP